MSEKRHVLYGLVTGQVGAPNQYFILPEDDDDGRVWVCRIGDVPDSVVQRMRAGEKVDEVWPELIGLPFQAIAGEETDAPDTVPAIDMPGR